MPKTHYKVDQYGSVLSGCENKDSSQLLFEKPVSGKQQTRPLDRRGLDKITPAFH